MRIKILDAGRSRHPLDAWALSRDKGADYDAAMVGGVDAPVVEMHSVLLHFQDATIYEREIFCSLRNHVVWARTSRVDDPLEFSIPLRFMDHINFYENCKQQMRTDKAAGMTQDQWRMHLPMIALTSWVQRISLRDMKRMAVYFGYLREKANDGEMKKLFGRTSDRIEEVIRLVTPYSPNDKLVKFLNEKMIPKNEHFSGTGEFTMISGQFSLALRAQIVRHRELQFVDDFFLLATSLLAPHMTLKNLVNMQIVARNDIWQAVLSKRACWIAQQDLWAPLVRQWPKVYLPCDDNGICPFEVDARARMENGKDPNPPCPRFCNLNNIDKDPWLYEMSKEAEKRGYFWTEQVNA